MGAARKSRKKPLKRVELLKLRKVCRLSFKINNVEFENFEKALSE